MSIAEAPGQRGPESMSPVDRGMWFHDRIKRAVETMSPRAKYFSDQIHVPTIDNQLCVGANPEIEGVRYDRSAELYAAVEDSGVTIGINRIRDEEGRERRSRLLIVRGGEPANVVDQPHNGFLVHIDPDGQATLSALDGGGEASLPETTVLDAVDFASGTILPLEKRSGTGQI